MPLLELVLLAVGHTRIASARARFASPLFEDGYLARPARPELPLLLYLPGFDGTLVSPWLQLPALSTDYDIVGLAIPMEDRSTFASLVDKVSDRLLTEPAERRVVLMGESFGGILTLAVALALERAGRPLSAIALVNPATCYLESELAARAPAIASLPPLAYACGVLSLLPIFGDRHMLAQILQLVRGAKLPQVIDTPEREAYMGRVALSLPSRLRWMPRDTLRWRLREWLTCGARYIRAREPELRSLRQPTCIVVGSADATLPSVAEGERLARLLPDVAVAVVPGAGHANTLGIRVNLAALFRRRFGGPAQPGAVAPLARLAVVPDGAEDDADLGLEDRAHPPVSPRDYWRF
ncbi:hypothetical protein KFE25_008715 [Diacronema lutheri]|uniref:AB hydrolase-1 domain-containing protein n=1 Tax=Diacronema lutheri TaxID=2081491 RepID=A0A8J5XTK9_DIALT|nr:hypothetical protein KFE25_008715 [Diacronema lutheri]